MKITDDIEKSEYNVLQEEIKSFKKVEVYNIAENSKSIIEKSICYIRPKQVEWTEEIQKSESGEEEKVKTGVYTDTVLNRNLDRVGKTYGEVEKSEEQDLEKGGEGSRGGKVVGHTKSGKPVYENKEGDDNDRDKLHKKYKWMTNSQLDTAIENHSKLTLGEKGKKDLEELKMEREYRNYSYKGKSK
jgi:hypothetical protein